ncbi:tandem-95 repeat protein [Anatilimnocola floriformis]|uniref:tandem-95 repeat protein n=1 Tax=Anatilimnocola floriformis TaxID=2948575 RepID=UPI0020C2257C|nr:Ig-like domain-containing protein [Anatilimnocola floriformis]
MNKVLKSKIAKKQRDSRRNGQDVNRRNFLRLESLENRLALTTLAAVNDAFHTGIDEPLNMGTPGVLANDIGNGLPLSASLFTGPANGTLTFNTNGSFIYTPNSGFSGQDSFVYSANDGAGFSNLAAVTIDVSEGTAPVSVDDVFSLNEDESLLIPGVTGVLANDGSAVGSTVALVSGPSSGQLTLESDGGFVYTPEANFSGEVTFTYRATNNIGPGNEATVKLTIAAVNDVPVAVNDSFSVDEDQPLNVTTSVMANDTDVEGSTLTPQLASQPMHGTVTFNPDGTFNYQAEANYNGIDGFSYLVNDGTDNSEVATVTIMVNPVNDAPVAGNDEYSMNEDEVLTIDANGVLANDSDIDGDTLTPTIVAQPLHGTVVMNADGSFTYTPAADFNGVDGFSYQVSDGTTTSDVASVTINIAPINDPPVAVNDEYTTPEDTELLVDIPGVILNDVDPDSTNLTTTLVSPPQHGSVELGSDGKLHYTPAADFNGVDGFSYTVSDGEFTSDVASVTITVSPVNDAPVSQADSYEVAEDDVLTVAEVGVLGNDSDVDSSPLTVTLGTGPTNGTLELNSNGTFVYTPNANFSGEDSFTYIASDGELAGEETTVTINVTPVNDAPVSVADSYEIGEDGVLTVDEGGVLANDTDSDSSPLTVTLGTGPTNGTVELAADGTFTYTPNADFNGEDSFTYIASDGELAGTETTVTITVTPENDKPFAEDDAYTTDENTPLQIDPAGVLANDSDIDGDALTASIVTGPTNGTLTLNSDGSFLYTPNAGFAGTDTFTYAAEDGTDAATAVVTITVNDVIQPPIVHADAYNVAEDMVLDISAAWGVLANDFDPQGTAMTAEVVTPPQHGQLVMQSDGSFKYTPDANYNGNDSFTYRAINEAGEATEGTASIVVQTVNDAPNAGDDSFTVAAGGTLTTTAATGVQANDTDIDSAPLTTILLQGPAHGTLTIAEDGSFTYTPNAGYTGPDEFIYQLNDGMANSNVAHASIAVTPAIEAPGNTRSNVHNDHYVVSADTESTVDAANGVLINDHDAQGDTMLATLFSNPQHGSVVLNTDGSFTYTPESGYVGTDSFLYWVNDGKVQSALAAVTLVVEAAPAESPQLVLGDADHSHEGAFDCVLRDNLWA